MPHKIGWLNAPGYKGETWNPFAGCSKCSPGCDNCYAERMAKRLKAMGVEKYQGVVDENGWTGLIQEAQDVWLKPLGWRKPRLVFVQSMGDLFHPEVSGFMLSRVFRVMKEAVRHRFLVLTKRIDRAAEFFRDHPCPKNVGLGVTVCNQEEADAKIPVLLGIPGAPMRFVSIEPMLGPVSMRDILPYLDWVIAGGETGPGARKMSDEWACLVRDDCVDADVPFFFKQEGGVHHGRDTLLGLYYREFPAWLMDREAREGEGGV